MVRVRECFGGMVWAEREEDMAIFKQTSDVGYGLTRADAASVSLAFGRSAGAIIADVTFTGLVIEPALVIF